jgi:uncharacterized protein (DUF433 family)
VSRPHISIDPGIQFGQPCIAGTRIPTEALAGRVFAGDSVATVMYGYDLDRHQVPLACWYEGTMGRKRYRKRWEKWADEHFASLAGRGVHLDKVPDPPSPGVTTPAGAAPEGEQ